MGWYWYLIIAWLVISLTLLVYEIKKAPVVDEKLPFLNGDYDMYNDPTKNHKEALCKNCLKNIDGIYCNNGKHLKKIGDDMVAECIKEQYFEPK